MVLGYESAGDAAADLFLGASDWDRARRGVDEGDWWDLISGVGMGALATASLVPVGLGRKAGRQGMRATFRQGDELVDGNLLGGGASVLPSGGGQPSARMRDPLAGNRADPVEAAFLQPDADTVADWTPGTVDTAVGPVVEPMPGARGSWDTKTIDSGRELAVRQRAKMMESNALANPEYLDELSGQLADDAQLDEVMRGLAPAGRGDLKKGNLQRLPDTDLFEHGWDADAGGAVRVSRPDAASRRGRPGELDAPLTRSVEEGGFNLTPSPYNRPELALPVLAARWESATGSAKQAAKREFAREFARQGQSILGATDATFQQGPMFYLDRADQIRSAATRVTTESGEEAFSPLTLAVATAASSANAAPIEEPARLLMALPFMRVRDGKAVFDETSRRMFQAHHGELADADMFFNGAKAFAETLNNPNILARNMPGIGHKTHPYAVLGMDPENPWAFVADRNLWYLAQSHNRQGVFGGARGGGMVRVGAADPMSTGLRGSAGTSSLARGFADALGTTPGTIQEVVWFLPRIMQQGDIADSFRLSRGMSPSADTFIRNRKGDQYMDDLYGLAADASPEAREAASAAWSDLLGTALESAGSFWGRDNVSALRNLGAQTSREFTEQVGTGQVRGWQLVDGRPVPGRDQWRNTLAPQDIYTGKTIKQANRQGLTRAYDPDAVSAEGGVDKLERVSEVGLVREIERAMEAMPSHISAIWQRLASEQRSMVVALVATGLSVPLAVERVSSRRGPVEDRDVDEMVAMMDDAGEGWV